MKGAVGKAVGHDGGWSSWCVVLMSPKFTCSQELWFGGEGGLDFDSFVAQGEKRVLSIDEDAHS